MTPSAATPLPPEDQRLRTLSDYHLVDTLPEAEFDRLVGLASRLFDVPIVLVSLVDADRQFFKAKVGLDVCETSREVSFCSHAIAQDDILVVPDALKDPRFASNPLVLGPPFIRFYAGKPLKVANGDRIGTVCLIDTKPHAGFSSEDRHNLTDLAALVVDRMEMRRLDAIRNVSQSRFENIAATSPDAIICSNAEGVVTFWNRSAERLFGYTAEEMCAGAGEIVPPSLRPVYEAELERLRHGQVLELADRTVELAGLRKDGTEFPAEFSLSTWREGDAASIGAIVRDVTERRENEDRLFRLASIDALTDLPNRSALRARLGQMLGAGQPASLLLLDLDGFKDVNDTLGHLAGDAVLKEAAQRMCAICPEAEMVARLGGDEFVVLLAGDSRRASQAVATHLITTLSRSYAFLGQPVAVGASIGIAVAPDHGTVPEILLNAADLALYRAKALGKGRFELFAPALREVAVARRAFERELHSAFENDEFELYYQPQVSTHDGAVTGAEALLRWNHPERGVLSPASFIDVLAQKPIAGEVGEWVLKTACRQAAAWRQTLPNFRMGVNLFEAQFRSGRLRQTVEEAMESFSLPPQALELEIVENILLQNDPTTLDHLTHLRDLGVGLAFDDYGTGYASLSLLKRYPVTRLKIDQSFIRTVTANREDAAIVRAVIYLGRNFGLDVIAEGVESEDQLAFLAENGCLEAQGYLFGRPVPANAFALVS
ncbi:putative bifunctional diguanylate cyclase/phosphodiesterase [Brevundimonas sp.]|jgi:diguanylate cyclase (GGDEF)-like protein/PAS domain S-box-containing protein|uniref:putative bifunctional diguanylate cyclase/phosphodiesterase n=1 Tax=Brevundimonas sp. TaxID=1871086 RepID=UPI0037BE3108